jgi:hypothetical protein
MADHYLKSIELLDELDTIRSEIARLYAEPVPSAPGPNGWVRPPGVRKQLATLHSRQGIVLKLAEIHASLSVRQALLDQALPA